MKLRCLHCVHSTLPFPRGGTGIQIPGMQNISQRPSSLPARTSIVWVSKVLSPEVKRAGREDYSPNPILYWGKDHMALYLHSPISINAMTLKEAHGQRLLGTSELLFPSKFKLLWMYVCMHVCMYFFPPWRYSPKWARPSLSKLHDYTQTHHIQLNSFGRVISPKQRPLPDKT